VTGYATGMADNDRHAAGAPVDCSADAAHDVQTVVLYEHGRWAVDIVVVFADGVVRKRIDTYLRKDRAEIAADLIKRAAERDIGGGPLYGMR
jgi:hypothetical protein